MDTNVQAQPNAPTDKTKSLNIYLILEVGAVIPGLLLVLSIFAAPILPITLLDLVPVNMFVMFFIFGLLPVIALFLGIEAMRLAKHITGPRRMSALVALVVTIITNLFTMGFLIAPIMMAAD